jgi:hypothetical protein
LPVLDDDVAQIRLERDGARDGAGAGRQGDELAIGARNFECFVRGEGETSRRAAHRAAVEHRSRHRIDGDDGTSAAQSDVHATGAVFDQAARLVALLERDGRAHGSGYEVGDDDGVALGIRRDGELRASDDESAAGHGWRLDGRPMGSPHVRRDHEPLTRLRFLRRVEGIAADPG